MPALLAALLLAGGCHSEAGSGPPGELPSGEAPAVLQVTAVNAPLASFCERLGGDAVRVSLPTAAGVDPAFWQPTPEEVSGVQAADLILLNGAGYAHWVARASLPYSRVVDTSAAFRADLIEVADSVVHSHGPAGAHTHGAIAFTTWLDPRQAIRQARAVRDALVRRLPDRSAAIEQAWSDLAADLERLDGDLDSVLEGVRSQPLLASHPVYQYFARRYRLDLRSVHWEPGEEPTPAQWSELRGLLAARPSQLMLWEGEPLPAVREELGGLGVRCVVVDPCGGAPTQGTPLDVWRANVERLRRAAASR